MQIPDELASAGFGGWMGWVAAAVVSGVMFFRRVWHADIVSGANSKAAVDAIQRLHEILDAERIEKSELRKLLADANAERNAAIRELGEIKAQLAALQAEVRMLRETYGHAG